MPSVYKGARSFVELLRRGADNIVNRFLDLGFQSAGLGSLLQQKFPDSSDFVRQQVVNLTDRSRQHAAEVQALPPDREIPISSAPVSPVLAVPNLYFIDVEFEDERSGRKWTRTVLTTATEGDTVEEAEQRAMEEASDDWDDSPEFDENGKPTSPKRKVSRWLRGMRGETIDPRTGE